MKILFWLFAFLVAFAGNILAQNKFYFKLGGNTSEFRNEDMIAKKGISVGLGYELFPQRFTNGFIAFELLYTSKKGILKNRTWPILDINGVNIGDFHTFFGYLEIPTKIGYFLKVNEKLKLKIFAGPSFSMRIFNKTSIENASAFLLDPEEAKNFKFDYERYELPEDPPGLLSILALFVDKTTLNFDIGTSVGWSTINLEFRYSRAFSKTKDIINLTLTDKIDAYYLSINVDL